MEPSQGLFDKLRQEPARAFHILAVLVAEFFDEIGFLFGRPDRHRYESQYPQEGDEPVIRHHPKRNDEGRPSRIKWMTHPAIRSARAEFMFLARRAYGSDACADTAEQPVNPEGAQDSDANAEPACPLREPNL